MTILTRRTFLAAAATCSIPAIVPARAQLVRKYAEELENGEYNWFPERSNSGPLLIIVSIPDQRVHVYRNGIRIAASSCSTGRPGHRTPTGVFKVLQKDKHHRSSTYSNAPMPNMNRLTWSGIALHAGDLPGYPASHGCVRLPMGFSELLFGVTRLGMTVVLADARSQPASVVHPGLVLGDHAREEFHAVDQAMKLAPHASAETSFVPASILVSRADMTATVRSGDQVVATGRADIAEPSKPIGERSYQLLQAGNSIKGMKWVAASGHDPDHHAAIKRITAEPHVRAAMRKHVHAGMTLVTTDRPSNTTTQSARGFVIADGLY